MIDKTLKEELLQFPNESLEDYISYLVRNKRSETIDITYYDIAELVLEKFGFSRSETYYRRYYVPEEIEDYSECEEETPEQISEQTLNTDYLLELKKQRAMLSDELTQNRAYVRRISREETIVSIAKNYAAEMNKSLILPKHTPSTKESEKEAILCLSDWHYGLDFKNNKNEFNKEIAKDRILKLKNDVVKYLMSEKPRKLHIVNLGDLIAGRIHLTIRLESRTDVISQVMEVAEILAEFINDLTEYVKIEYYSVVDNHSRLEPKKEDSLKLESLARIIDWFIKYRLEDKITIKDNMIGNEITEFECLGHKILVTHGDNDNPKNAIERLGAFTNTRYSLILTAHRHHMFLDDQFETVLLSNGCLIGTDTYAYGLRVHSAPSQNLIIVTKENVIEMIHRILVS